MKTTYKNILTKSKKPQNRRLVTVLGIASYGIFASQLNVTYANTYPNDITADGCAICELNTPSDNHIVTGGNVTSNTHFAIGSSTDGNTNITTAAGKLLSGWVGIAASTGSGGSSAVDMSITNNSDINSSGNGIDIGDFKFGHLSLINNGTINSSDSVGISISHNNSNNQALPSTTIITTNGAITAKNIGIYASSNASDGLSINANADISGDQAGIQAFAGGSAALTINSKGNISATNPNDQYYIRYYPENKPPYPSEVENSPAGAIHAYSKTGPIQITTAAGKTLTSVSNGITARSDSGEVNIDNASDIKTTGFVRETSECSELAGGCSVPENERIAGNGIDVSQALGGSIISNTGNIEVQKSGFLTPAGKVILGGSAIEKVTTTSGTLTGDIELADGNDELHLSGGALIGSAKMGLGDDQLKLNGLMDLSQITQLDGGTAMGIPENPAIVENDALTADGANFNGFSGSNDINKGINLTGWETINLVNGSVLKLTDNLFESNGTLNIDNASLIELSGGNPFTINGSVQNQGYMSQYNGFATNSTVITGDYLGGPESRIYMDVALNGDDSHADKLTIQGNTSGQTAVNVFNADGLGAKTVEGIKIIQVDGSSNGQFNLAAPVQAGSYEYTLAKNGLSTPDDGDWYLRSTFTCPVEDPICGGSVIDPTTMFRPAIAAYVAAQTYNADQGLSFMSASHQRIGEQRGLLNNASKTWARTLLSTQSNKGKTRFEYDQNTSGVQFGHDLLDKNTDTGSQRAGISAQYAYSRIDTRDRMRPIMGFEDMAGTVGSTLVGVGGYYTRTKSNGGYLDVVAQLNHLRNKFVDVYVGKSTQNAWQTGLSVELGQPVGHIGSWTLEPQAQMSYLYSNYDGIVDAMSIIKPHSTEYLRGRLGLRLAKEIDVNGQQANYYGIANLSHNFINPKVTTQIIDSTDGTLVNVSEKFDTTSLELGAGVQGQIGKTSYLYADARFQRSLNRNKTGAQFNIGFKKSF